MDNEALKQQIKDLITEVNRETGGVVPFHTHNGIDSPLLTFPSAALSLLKAGSGSSTNTSATNLDTVSLSGLTANDTLLIYYDIQTTGASGATNPRLYNNTDGIVLSSLLNTNGINITSSSGGYAALRQEFVGTTNISAIDTCMNGSTTTGSNIQSIASVTYRTNTVTTPWTSDWILAFRSSGGVSAAATTQYWSWAVYKLAGQ